MAELERSALEAKDREELLAIANALGGKPGSRARKAGIIDLILELTGVTPAPAAGAAAAEPTATAPEPDAASDGPAVDGEVAPTRSRRSRRSRSSASAAAPDESADGADEASTVAAVATDDGGEDGAGETETAASGEPADVTETDAAVESTGGAGGGRGGRDRTRTDGPSEQAAPSGGGQGGPEGDAEGNEGGRRRRRRGRERGGERSPERTDEPFNGEPVGVEGILDLRDEGYGFIRVKGFLPSRDDVYVSVKQTRQFSLRRGDLIVGASRPASRNEKNPALLRIDSVNGVGPDQARARQRFEDLTPLFPDERLVLSSRDEPYNMTTRILDLVAPIGKGQRGLIVSPPKAGKTTIMKHIATAIEKHNPEVHLIVLLVDERPEEVTDMRRTVAGEVVASTFDHPAEEHTAIAELVIERAKRLVEDGKDVVVILDGITRLARAYNLAAPQGGRIMSGGIDTGALYPPKKFFGAARNVEEGGSLTILASALVETGSKMDEVIFEEFKGTGNMELRLDRRMAERRVYPAIDVDGSSTRHEELLFDRKQLQQVWKLRRVLSGLASDSGSGAAGLEMLVDRLGTFRTNDEFLAEIAKG
ncbi:MAG TPA: transcription termination factor Rho [Acidimicrobiales bacterium]